MSYTIESVLLANAAQAVAASATNQVVSKEFVLSAEDSLNSVFEFKISGHSGTVTGKLQTSTVGSGGDENFVDGKTVSITGNGWFSIKISSTDATNDADFLPLRCVGRLVITTAGSSGATVDAARRTRR